MPTPSPKKNGSSDVKRNVDFFSITIAFSLLYVLISWVLVLRLGNERKEQIGFLLERRISGYVQEFESAKTHFERLSLMMFQDVMANVPTAVLMDRIQYTEPGNTRDITLLELRKSAQNVFERLKPQGLESLAFYSADHTPLLMFGPNDREPVPLDRTRTDEMSSWFSAGKDFNGYRSLIPVYTSGRKVGCVVFSFPVDSLLDYMQDTTHAKDYLYLLRSSLFDEPMSKESSRNFQMSILSKNYQVVRGTGWQDYAFADNGEEDNREDLLKEMVRQFRFADKEGAPEAFVVNNEASRNIFGYLPIKNSKGDPVAVLIILEINDPDLLALHEESMRKSFKTLIGSGLLILLCAALLKLYLAGRFRERIYTQHLRTVAAQLPGIIFQIRKDENGDFTFTYCSEAIRTLFSLTPRQVVDAPEKLLGLFEPAEREIFLGLFSGDAVTYHDLREFKLTEIGKEDRWFEASASLDPSIPDRWNGYLTEITHKKENERKLSDANREQAKTNELLQLSFLEAQSAAMAAEAATRSKSEFLANMSHEIRTPMNGVLGMIGLLLDTPLNHEQKRYAESVESSAQALLTLINDILDFSKIEAGRLELEAMDYDLNSMIEDFSLNLAVKAQEKKIEFLCDVDSRIPGYINGDSGRLRQVLTNLVGNAIKFTQKGEVVLGVHLVEDLKNSVRLRFSVRDTGIGIPKEAKDLLFDKFTQVDASITRRFGGTGLGLAISKELVELMGGELQVESELGKGSDFSFVLEMQKTHLAHDQELEIPDTVEGVRVLVVDDNQTNREIITKRLHNWKMRVTEAEGGVRALELLKEARLNKDPFVIAVLDMQMPDIDGVSLARTIKSDSNLEDTRLVLMSSVGLSPSRFLIEQIGFSSVLMKPVPQSEMLHALLNALAVKRKAQEPRSSTSPMAKSYRGSRVLVAEDNPINQQVAIGMLKRFDIHADAVASGEEAIYALETLPYDLVLMDVQMPILDGLDATRRIRSGTSQVLHPEIPIVAMTANAMEGDRRLCLESGMNDYIAKPVSQSELVRILGMFLHPSAEETQESVASSPEKVPPEKETAPEPEESVASKEVAPSIYPVIGTSFSLKDELGDLELVQSIVEEVVESTQAELPVLQSEIENELFDEAAKTAHRIRGALLNLAADRLCDRLFQVETACKAQKRVEAQVLMNNVETDFSELRAELKKQHLVSQG